ncbi:unnamed protein product [Prorocentrum cordatum]|uniref:Uncharacterized protein n=1 Tax=Prorocentrum cordatum TaxID=2364126 RepID=A0ABN9TTD1_9DINO|nr:unnamed protein product [Polarella glacialis]
MALVPPAMEAAEALAATAHATGGGSEGTLGVLGNGGPGGSAAGILLSAPGGSSSPLAPSLDIATAVRSLGMDESMFRGFVQEIGGVWEEVTLGEIFDMFDEDLVAAMRTCNAVTDEGEVRPLSSLQRGHVRRGLQRLAELAGQTPKAWGGSAQAVKAPPAAAPAQQQAPQQVVVTPTMHEFSTVIEQGRRTTFQELSSEKVRTLCEAYDDKWGTPRDYEDCSALQLSALAAKLGLDESPWVDFARIQKLLYFNSDVFVNGEYIKRKILGPSNFEGFRKSWQVFRTAALKLDFTKAGPVDSYLEGVRQLATLFPRDWGTIYTVVSHNMEERWDQLRAKMERAVQNGKPPDAWDPKRPWQAIASHAKSYSVEFSTEENADAFADLCSGLDSSWADPRNQRPSIIRVRGDLPVDVRERQRAASMIWQQTLDLIKAGGRSTHTYKLGVNGYQGLIHLSSPDDVYELFWIKGSAETGYQCDPVLESFREWNVNDQAVLDMLPRVSHSTRPR